jgi:hypothetical protein
VTRATADEFATSVRKLAGQVSHWTPSRWAASSRAAVLHELLQRLADRTADAEAEPHREVPRLANDLALPDQLRVIAADAMAAGAADETALAWLQATRRTLLS